MNIQLKNSAHHFCMQSECEQTLVTNFPDICAFRIGFSFTMWNKKSEKKIRKEVRGCLQNLYQWVAIHLKYVLLVLL